MEFKDKILPQLLQAIKNRTPIHKQIPNKGKIVFNKIVPYLFIYRIPDSGKDYVLSELTKSELASILFLPNSVDDQVNLWVPKLATALANEFGTCLLIEVWSATEDQNTDFAIHLSQKNALVLAEYLKKNIETEAPEISVELQKETKLPRPPRLPLLVDTTDTKNNIVLSLGISVRKRYENIDGTRLPLLARAFRESLAKGLSRLFFEFVRLYTTAKAAHFKMKGQEKLNAEIYDIDRALAKESQKFDFLLLTTPTNSHEAWLQFRKDKYRKAPVFHYRPIPIDPDIVKRNLYDLRSEDIYDPTIAYLFRDKRRELDDMMTMLASRGTSDFKYGSLMVFGNVDEQLYGLAKAVLTVIDSITQPERHEPEDDFLDAKAFAQLAEEEI